MHANILIRSDVPYLIKCLIEPYFYKSIYSNRLKSTFLFADKFTRVEIARGGKTTKRNQFKLIKAETSHIFFFLASIFFTFPIFFLIILKWVTIINLIY